VLSVLPATAFVVLLFKLKPQPLPQRHAPSPVRLSDPRLRRPLLVAFSAMLSVTVSQITLVSSPSTACNWPRAKPPRRPVWR
jgi:hypothetical protein